MIKSAVAGDYLICGVGLIKIKRYGNGKLYKFRVCKRFS